ncbi:MAG: DNA polymerase I [Alphaproteobacteria bacterium CG_4_10_14_0_8_um_filter_53_9]|nr:MAG: DNA polymerase I [Alphaproteobacteria bacterium CG_4_10_14_0_8_um_filter_53_9]
MQNHLVLIDGMSFIFRAYHAVRNNLTRSDGFPTNALFGFTQMLIKVVNDLQPDACVMVLDSPPPNWRHKLDDKYKANRPPPDEDLVKQLGKLEDLVRAFGIPILREQGLEADDLIATAVKQSITHSIPYSRVTIVTSDKDLLQLVGDFDNNGNPTIVKLLDTLKDEWQGAEKALDKFGVTPAQVRDVQALMGDSSDNIPGVPGVGPKTAAQLIQQFGSLQNMYENIEDMEKVNLRQKLKDNEAAARLSYQLVGLKDDCSLPPHETFTFHPTYHKAAEYLREELEFTTLASRLLKKHEAAQNPVKQKSAPAQSSSPKPENQTPTDGWGPYTLIQSEESWQSLLKEIDTQGLVAIDTETTGLDPYAATLVGLSFATATDKAYYLPLTHTDGAADDLFNTSALLPNQLPTAKVLEELKPRLQNPKLTKVFHNLKYDLLILARAYGIIPAHTKSQLQDLVQGYEDSMLLSASLHGGKWNHALDDLTKRHLDHENIPFKEVCGTGKSQITFAGVPLDKATQYAAEDADATLRLWHLLSKESPEPPDIYTQVERPLIPTLAALEARGVCVNTSELKALSYSWNTELNTLAEEIQTLAGHPFNVQSPAQLAVVVFDEMGLGTPAQIKKRSTASDVLEDMQTSKNPTASALATKMLRHRQLAKLRSTYAEALLSQISPLTGRVHTSYHQVGAATGRFSSSNPNLQNIPIRTEEGRKIRHAFIPQKGWQMLAADYSQIELRLLAHFSGSQALKQAFEDGLDIHAYTAALVAGKEIDGVSKEERRAAKFVNFGLVYGMGARSLAGQIGCSVAEAQEWIDAYFTRYKGVKEYMESNKQQARDNGYVTTLLGRKVWLPDIHSPNGMLRSGAERAAINAPLQGSNADIIKKAMPHVEKYLAEKNLNAQTLMQVHDELVLECPPDEVEKLTLHLPKLMTEIVHLSVPLVVEVGLGDNWETAH